MPRRRSRGRCKSSQRRRLRRIWLLPNPAVTRAGRCVPMAREPRLRRRAKGVQSLRSSPRRVRRSPQGEKVPEVGRREAGGFVVVYGREEGPCISLDRMPVGWQGRKASPRPRSMKSVRTRSTTARGANCAGGRKPRRPPSPQVIRSMTWTCRMSLTAKNARSDCPWRPMAEMGRGSGMLFVMEGTPSSPPLFSVIASPNAGYRPRGRRANPPPLEARRYGVGAGEAEPCKVQLSCVVLEQEEAADEAGGADLKYLLARQGVKIENQRIFFHHGITTVEKLVSLAKDREDLVQALKDHWDLDQTPSLTERAQVAAVACLLQCVLKIPESGGGGCRAGGPR